MVIPIADQLRNPHSIFEAIEDRISDSLRINSKPKNKEFWYGFLTALYDYKVISADEYANLQDLVNSW